MLNKSMKIDDIDQMIVTIIQSDPNITHNEIAEKVHRSQPTVGIRIKKLVDIGILDYQAGLNLKKSNIYFANVNIQTKYPNKITEIIKGCPHMIYAFRLSGLRNFQILIAGSKIQELDMIVNYHFRTNPIIHFVSMEIVLDILNDLILPVDLKFRGCICTSNTKKIYGDF